MRVLWDGEWLEAPPPPRSNSGLLVEVQAAIPLIRVTDPAGRTFESKWRKLATFAVLEGPLTAYRKARAKLREQALTRDFRVVAFLGTEIETGSRVVGIACRVPPCASMLQAHRDLVAPVDGDFDEPSLARVADALLQRREVLKPHSADPFLFSGRTPPTELGECLREALARGASVQPADVAVIRAPKDTTSDSAAIRTAPGRGSGVPVALLGAGDYARTVIAPALHREGFRLEILADREPHIAALAGRELGFARAMSDAEGAIEALPEGGLAVVATYHDSHATLAARALRAGHRVFLEKPAVVTAEDLDLLVAACRDTDRGIEVGFNRRYHPLVRQAQAALAREAGPTTFTAVVREVPLEPHHWYLWPNQGTRITGNLCHWIDLAVAFAPVDATIESVGTSPAVDGRLDLERAFTLAFDDGSAATLVATERGDATRGVQEWIEVRRGGTTIVLDDLRRLRVVRGGTSRTRPRIWRERGHRRMYAEALDRVRRGAPPVYPLSDLVAVSRAQIAMTALATAGPGAQNLTRLGHGMVRQEVS